MAIIEFQDVSFSYPGGFTATEHVSFEIEKGQNIAIVGQNGAGKTTTVKMINGLLKPSEGAVLVDGMDTRDFTAAKLSRKAGYVFQNPDDQIFHNTVGAEIRFGPKVLGYDGEKAEGLIRFAAKITGLTSELEENPYNLPLSMRKFVTIASVLAMDTDILILDEPTAGQDQAGIKTLEEMMTVLKEQGKTMITITHDMEFVVNNFDHVFVMAHKNLLRTGRPGQIFADGALLEESMLKRPFVCDMAEQLKLGRHITTLEALADCLAGGRT